MDKGYHLFLMTWVLHLILTCQKERTHMSHQEICFNVLKEIFGCIVSTSLQQLLICRKRNHREIEMLTGTQALKAFKYNYFSCDFDKQIFFLKFQIWNFTLRKISPLKIIVFLIFLKWYIFRKNLQMIIIKTTFNS